MVIINGFQNELDFVQLFNGKLIGELDENSKRFLRELFGEIDDNIRFIAWKNRVNQKTDIFIKYKNYIKNISLKCGNNNSMHQEPIQNFKLFLSKLGITYNVIDYYVSYHYGYAKKNGKTDFSKLLDSMQYKDLYQDEIDIFNKFINKTKIIIEMIDRFIIRGNNSDYDIDVLVCGTINDYVWIMKDDIYDMILSNRNNGFTSPHIGNMTIGPKKRNLVGNSNYIRERYIVCVRWNNIREDIINYKNNSKYLT